MNGAERHLVVKSTVGAGLGDRVRALLSAILYARQSERSLQVMWDDGLYGPEGENVFPRLFELRELTQHPLDLDRRYRCRPAFWGRELRQPMKVLYGRYGPAQWDRPRVIDLFSFDQARLDYDEEVLVMWEFDQFGRCREPTVDWGDHSFVSSLARTHLVPASAVRDAVAGFREARFRPDMIGVHVRQTKEAGSRTKRVKASRYDDLIERIRRRTPRAGIFLATDNAEVQARFLARYGEAVVTTEKWFAAAGEPLHLADGRPDPLQNALEALMDMFLLAACDHLIYPASSSFGMTASYFSSALPGNLHPLEPSPGIRGHFGRLWHLLP